MGKKKEVVETTINERVAGRSYNVFANNEGFRFIELGKEKGRPSLKVWINGNVSLPVDDDNNEYITFPAEGISLSRTEKGTYVLRQKDGVKTFDVFCSPGKNGSQLKIVSAFQEAADYHVSLTEHSSGGAHGVLVCTRQDEVVYDWERFGPSYGAAIKTGRAVISAEGFQQEIDQAQ